MNKKTQTLVGLAVLAAAGYYLWDKSKSKKEEVAAAPAAAAPEAAAASFTGEVGKRLRGADGAMPRLGRRPARPFRPLPTFDEAAPVSAIPVKKGEKLNLQLGMPSGGGEVFAGADGWMGKPLTTNIAGGFFNVKNSSF